MRLHRPDLTSILAAHAILNRTETTTFLRAGLVPTTTPHAGTVDHMPGHNLQGVGGMTMLRGAKSDFSVVG
jgi:hypothetical protein